MSKPSIGYEYACASRLDQALEQAKLAHIDFVILPLVHPRQKRDSIGVSDAREAPLTRSDLLLSSGEWSNFVVGRISKWIDLDSVIESTRNTAEQVFKQEVAWATHLSLPAVVTSHPKLPCHNYARVVNQAILQANHLHFWVEVPLTCGDEDTWKAWSTLRTMCEYHSSLHVALRITEALPSASVMDRWVGEPVKALLLPTSVFLRNKHGYPTLSKKHQRFVLQMFKLKVQFVVTGRPGKGHDSVLPYQMYLAFLVSKVPPPTLQQENEVPYHDYLQAPLQPLMDNLESQTYETFEKDPIKYQQYEEAVRQALLDFPVDRTVTLMVVGAGRGPLVRCSLRASEKANRKLNVYAVEKNPNAVVTLRNMKHMLGWNNVTIVHQDMRKWQPTELADILVSELLGSWGDNELSPECLDGAQRLLKPEGISIPCEYTSFVSPISTTKLWNEVNGFKDLKHFETPYVVMLHQFYEMAPSQPCFTFAHPNWAEKIDNRRFEKLEFTCQEDAVMHGFAGYFEAKLYKDVMISIRPETFSEGMFSWFPIYIPIRNPFFVKKGDTVAAQFWRQVSSSNVWYEWSLTSPECSYIHNPNGRSYSVGLLTS